eukprot:g520.t1
MRERERPWTTMPANASQSLARMGIKRSSNSSNIGGYWGLCSSQSFHCGGSWSRARRSFEHPMFYETPGPGPATCAPALANSRLLYTRSHGSFPAKNTANVGQLPDAGDKNFHRYWYVKGQAFDQHEKRPGPLAHSVSTPSTFAHIQHLERTRYGADQNARSKLHSVNRRIKKCEKALESKGTLNLSDRVFFAKEKKRLPKLRRQRKQLRQQILAAKAKKEAATTTKKVTDRFADEKREVNERAAVPSWYIRLEPFGKETIGRAPRFVDTKRRVPAFHFKDLYKGMILLEKDRSFAEVGPGQFTPTLVPAEMDSPGLKASMYAPNPRSAATVDDVQVWSRSKEINRGMSTTMRKSPYAPYGGGGRLIAVDSGVEPAFYPSKSMIRSPQSEADSSSALEFCPAVPAPLSKQRQGPKLMPMRMHLKEQARARHKMKRKADIDADMELVAALE